MVMRRSVRINKDTYSARIVAFAQRTVVDIVREAVLTIYFTVYGGTLHYKTQRTDNSHATVKYLDRYFLHVMTFIWQAELTFIPFFGYPK